jgi:hypothetical protein
MTFHWHWPDFLIGFGLGVVAYETCYVSLRLWRKRQ